MLLRVSLLTWLAFAAITVSALAGPFPLVVLENDQRQTGGKSNNSASKFADNPDYSERHKVKKGDSCSKLSINITPMPDWTGIFSNLPLSRPIAGLSSAIIRIFICRPRSAFAIGEPDQIHGHAPLWFGRSACASAGIHRSYFLFGALNEAI